MKGVLLGLALSLSLGSVPCVALASAPFIDLHVHPFMDDGMGTLFHGKFESELRATDWTAKLSSQINIESLEASQLGIVVVSLYAHPVFANGRKPSIRRQLVRVAEFVKTHPNWIIARGPVEAQRALHNGKRVLILALEGASGVLESEADLREFIDEHGIRIVTLLHLTDDHLGGSAFFKSFKGLLLSPISWFLQMFSPTTDSDGVKLNRNGLSQDGVELTHKLLQRKVWIDLAHASDEAQKALIPILREAHQPLLYTHVVLRKYYPAERGMAEWQISEVEKTGGIIGLMPSEEMLEHTPSQCDDGIHKLAEQFKTIGKRIGASSMSIGSDFNGGINHLKPPVCPTGTKFDAQGLWNIGQSGDMWYALKSLGIPWPASDDGFITTFLQNWAKFQL